MVAIAIDDFHVTRRRRILRNSDTLVGKESTCLGMALSRLRQPETQESKAKMLLLNSQGLGHDEAEELTGILSGMTLKQLKVLAKDCNIRLTGSSKKGEVMDRILAMARISAIRGKHDEDDDEATGISYITDEVKSVLRTLPLFSRVTEWSKEQYKFSIQ